MLRHSGRWRSIGSVAAAGVRDSRFPTIAPIVGVFRREGDIHANPPLAAAEESWPRSVRPRDTRATTTVSSSSINLSSSALSPSSLTPVTLSPADRDIAAFLRNAASASDVLSHFKQNRSDYDAVNTATALTRVMALQGSLKPWKRDPLLKSDMNALVNHSIEELRGVTARFHGQTLHAVGRRNRDTGEGAPIAATIAALGPRVLPRTIASLLWGLSRLDRLPAVLLDEASIALAERAAEFTPADTVQITYAFSRANVPAPRLFNAVSAAVVPRLDSFAPHELSSLLLSYTSLGITAPDLFAAVAAKVTGGAAIGLPTGGAGDSSNRGSNSSVSSNGGSGSGRDVSPRKDRVGGSLQFSRAPAAHSLAAETLTPQTTANLAAAFARCIRSNTAIDVEAEVAEAGASLSAADPTNTTSSSSSSSSSSSNSSGSGSAAGENASSSFSSSSRSSRWSRSQSATASAAQRAACVRAISALARRAGDIARANRVPLPSSGPIGAALTAAGLAQVAWAVSLAFSDPGVRVLSPTEAEGVARALHAQLGTPALPRLEEGQGDAKCTIQQQTAKGGSSVIRTQTPASPAFTNGAAALTAGAAVVASTKTITTGASASAATIASAASVASLRVSLSSLLVARASHVSSHPLLTDARMAASSSEHVLTDSLVASTFAELGKAVTHRQVRRTLAAPQLATLARAWASVRAQLQLRLANALAVADAATTAAEAEAPSSSAESAVTSDTETAAAWAAATPRNSSMISEEASSCSSSKPTDWHAVASASRLECSRIQALLLSLRTDDVFGAIVVQSVTVLTAAAAAASASTAGQLTPSHASAHHCNNSSSGGGASAQIAGNTSSFSASSIVPARAGIPPSFSVAAAAQSPTSTTSRAFPTAALSVDDAVALAGNATGAIGVRARADAAAAAFAALQSVARTEGMVDLANDIRDAHALATSMRGEEELQQQQQLQFQQQRSNSSNSSQLRVRHGDAATAAAGVLSSSSSLPSPTTSKKYDALAGAAESASLSPFALRDMVEICDALTSAAYSGGGELFHYVHGHIVAVEREMEAAAAGAVGDTTRGGAPGSAAPRSPTDLFRRSLRDLSAADTAALLSSFFWSGTAEDAGDIAAAVSGAFCREQALFRSGLSLELGGEESDADVDGDGGGGAAVEETVTSGGVSSLFSNSSALAAGSAIESADSRGSGRNSFGVNFNLSGAAAAMRPPTAAASESSLTAPLLSDEAYVALAAGITDADARTTHINVDAPVRSSTRTTPVSGIRRSSSSSSSSGDTHSSSSSSSAPFTPSFDDEPTFELFAASSRVSHAPRARPPLRLRGEGAPTSTLTAGSANGSTSSGDASSGDASSGASPRITSAGGGGTLTVVDDETGRVMSVRAAAGGNALARLGGLAAEDAAAAARALALERHSGSPRNSSSSSSSSGSSSGIPSVPALTSTRGWAHRLLFMSPINEVAKISALLALALPVPKQRNADTAQANAADAAIAQFRAALKQHAALSPVCAPREWSLPGGVLHPPLLQQLQRGQQTKQLQLWSDAQSQPQLRSFAASSAPAPRGIVERRWRTGLPLQSTSEPPPASSPSASFASSSTRAATTDVESGALLPPPQQQGVRERRLRSTLHSLSRRLSARHSELPRETVAALLELAAGSSDPSSGPGSSSSAGGGFSPSSADQRPGELKFTSPPMGPFLWTAGAAALKRATALPGGSSNLSGADNSSPPPSLGARTLDRRRRGDASTPSTSSSPAAAAAAVVKTTATLGHAAAVAVALASFDTEASNVQHQLQQQHQRWRNASSSRHRATDAFDGQEDDTRHFSGNGSFSHWKRSVSSHERGHNTAAPAAPYITSLEGRAREALTRYLSREAGMNRAERRAAAAAALASTADTSSEYSRRAVPVVSSAVRSPSDGSFFDREKEAVSILSSAATQLASSSYLPPESKAPGGGRQPVRLSAAAPLSPSIAAALVACRMHLAASHRDDHGSELA